MNKLKTIVVSGIVAAMSFSSIANSIEIRAGITANSAAYYGNVTETLKDSGDKTSEEALAAFSYASGFAEIAADAVYGIGFGVEYVPDAISLSTADRVIQTSQYAARTTPEGEDTQGGVQNITVDVTDLLTAYLAIPLMDTGLSLKLGLMQGSMETKETLATGSTYGNHDIEGSTIGLFYDGGIGDMAFYRIEGAYIEFDDITANGSEVGGTTGSFNKIVAEMGGVKASLSVGIRF